MTKKDEKPAAKKRHVSPRFAVQLPGKYKAPLEALAAKNRRTMGSEITLALDRWFAASGVTWPDDDET